MIIMSKVAVVKNCMFCKKDTEIPVTKDQLQRINSGSEPIQSVIPNVSPAERELFISGICGECFDDMF